MADHLIVGHARVVDAPGLGFPDTRLVQDHRTLAELGRLSWFNVFFGPGQLVVLPDGTRWRVGAFSRSRWVCPMVAVEGGGSVARSSPGDRNYGINTRDHAYSLSPAEARRGRARRWVLVEQETEVAVVRRIPFAVDASVPVHLGVVVLAFALCSFGVLGERDLVPVQQVQ